MKWIFVIPSLSIVLLLMGCQSEKTVEQASAAANRQLAQYRAELMTKVSVENTYYVNTAANLVDSAPEVEAIGLDDELTRSSRSFVINFVRNKADTVTVASELEAMVDAFASSWQSEQAARKATYSEALVSLQKNHQTILAAQDKLSALSGKLRTLSLPYSNPALFALLVDVGEQVKTELDAQEKKDSAAAAASATTMAAAKRAVSSAAH